MTKTFRLGCNIPTLTDGTSYYRGLGPLSHLKRLMGKDLELMINPMEVNWAWFMSVDAMFLQRPFTENHMLIINRARINGKPVWIDYDDDLFSIPTQNPTSRIYNRKDIQKNVGYCILHADIVSVSTVYLQRRLQTILKNIADNHQKKYADESGGARDRSLERLADPDKIIVVPNGYDSQLCRYSYNEWRKPPENPSLNLMWRGSSTHDADLSKYTLQLVDAFVRHSNVSENVRWTMTFVGSPWWGTLKHIEENAPTISEDQVVVAQEMDIMDYMAFLPATKPAAIFVPLVDDPFNRCKSNIAWIEAAHAGAMCLAPDWEEWQRPGIINYKDEADFHNKIANILRSKFDHRALVQESRNFIDKNLTLDVVNLQRLWIIRRLEEIDVWR